MEYLAKRSFMFSAWEPRRPVALFNYVHYTHFLTDVPQKDCIRLYFSFRPSRLNVSPSETKIEPDRRLVFTLVYTQLMSSFVNYP